MADEVYLWVMEVKDRTHKNSGCGTLEGITAGNARCD